MPNLEATEQEVKRLVDAAIASIWKERDAMEAALEILEPVIEGYRMRLEELEVED